ncbi:hypothetical protein MBRA_06281 [Methylobacterium brachiatum]|nr:hypothetical protein MBRA_06281 [Methylobacterium brachiatum]
MYLRSEAMAFLEDKINSNPNFWTDFARKLQDQGYAWRYEDFRPHTNRAELLKETVISSIKEYGGIDLDPKFILFNFSSEDYDTEFAFYNANRYTEKDILEVLAQDWKKKIEE